MSEQITRPINREQLDRFMETYHVKLLDAVTAHPQEYSFPATRPDVLNVAARMENAIVRGSYSHDGRAFKATCKALGIKHTRGAIETFMTTGGR